MGSYPKPQRVSDEALKAEVRAQGCVVHNCDCTPGVDPHHVKTRGSGGDDRREILMPLCRFHHTEAGQIGQKTFQQKYGIEYDRTAERWVRPKHT